MLWKTTPPTWTNEDDSPSTAKAGKALSGSHFDSVKKLLECNSEIGCPRLAIEIASVRGESLRTPDPGTENSGIQRILDEVAGE
jgi:hypothetical protein